MKKRADLQGIRGIAIVSVLLYHFFPNTFKNGYVGVDQFFVLSGFLMAEILSRERSISISSLCSFYYRRMKRILPLYSMIIFSTLSICLLVFPFPFFTYNIPYALRSLTFVSNIPIKNDGPSYEELLANAQVLFTHTWSLSCEVQFYIIAPFLLVSPYVFSTKVWLIITGIISYLLFIYLWAIDMQDVAFNMMPTRIWQFSLGCLCSVTSQKIKPTNEFEKPLVENVDDDSSVKLENHQTANILFNCNSFMLIFICLFPIEIAPHFVRVVVGVLSVSTMYTKHNISKVFLSNKYLVYLGDISYSLYLIHYPVCVFLKQKHFNHLTGSIIGIIMCILLAAFIYKTYEKFYLKLKKTGIVTLTIVLYVACLILIISQSPEIVFKKESQLVESEPFIEVPNNLTIDKVIGLNNEFEQWNYQTDKNACILVHPETPLVCTINNTNFSGSKRFLLIGNSYAGNIARMFITLTECQQKAKEIHMYTPSGCEVLENTGEWADHCRNFTEIFQEVVAQIKPDVLFISTRQMTPMMPVKGDLDTILETEKGLLKRMEENVNDKVYILNAIPRQIGNAVTTDTINNGLKSGKKVSQDSLWDKAQDYELARKRMNLLAKQCLKCTLIDVMPTFMKNGTFNFITKKMD